VWTSRRGEPLSIAETVLARTVVTMLVVTAMAWVTYSVPAGFVTGLAAYLVMDRALILIDWAREVRAQRRADARVVAALRVPVRARMAVRP
jgi:hypothetical protein